MIEDKRRGAKDKEFFVDLQARDLDPLVQKARENPANHARA